MAGARGTQSSQGLSGLNAGKAWGVVVVDEMQELSDAFGTPGHAHFVNRQRANRAVEKIVKGHEQTGALLCRDGRQLTDRAIMRPAWPLFKTRREQLLHDVGVELTKKADDFGS